MCANASRVRSSTQTLGMDLKDVNLRYAKAEVESGHVPYSFERISSESGNWKKILSLCAMTDCLPSSIASKSSVTGASGTPHQTDTFCHFQAAMGYLLGFLRKRSTSQSLHFQRKGQTNLFDPVFPVLQLTLSGPALGNTDSQLAFTSPAPCTNLSMKNNSYT